MTALIIPNHHIDAEISQLTFDLKTGQLLTDDKQIIKKSDIESVIKFNHPILTEKPLVQIKPNFYFYIYTNDTEFYMALRYIYASLLRSENPDKCFFQIKPTEQFFNDTKSLTFYFSNHPKKAAKQRLSVRQLNSMMSEIYTKTFKYCNQVFLDDILTYIDLPPSLNADDLYQEANEYLENDHQAILEKCEIRYINNKVGFGVYAHSAIPKGTLIAQYCGKYLPKKIAYQNYSYLPGKKNGYNLMLDAQLYGNIARFINHAPDPDKNTQSDAYLSANLIVENHPRYGNRRIMMIANRDIMQGEQLLSYYGEDYFSISENIFGMLKNGDVVDMQHHQIKDTFTQRKTYLSIFAGYGDKRSRWALFKRPIIIAVLCVCLKCILNV